MTDLLPSRREIPIAEARSWLLISGGAPESYGETPAADVSVIDLEDGVLPDARHAARAAVADFLTTESSWVRISEAGSSDFRADIDALRNARGLSGVVLAKSECALDLAEVERMLPGVPIVALIESALGVERALEIASAPGVVRLAFGKGDYRRDTGVADDPLALAYARGRLVNASRAARLAAPIDGPCLGDAAARHAALTVTKAAGMTGMLCLDGIASEQINRELSPTAEELAWAAATIDRLGPDGERVRAGCDVPMLSLARRIRERGAVFAA